MKLLLRFVGWCTVLAYPCWLVSPAYQRRVSAAVTGISAFFGLEFKIGAGLEVFAPMDLGLFVALCLASSAVSFRLRFRSVAFGLPLLAAMEVLTVFLLATIIWATSDQLLVQRSAHFFMGYAINGIVWVNPILVWLVFLGRWQLLADSSVSSLSQSCQHGVVVHRN